MSEPIDILEVAWEQKRQAIRALSNPDPMDECRAEWAMEAADRDLRAVSSFITDPDWGNFI